jgi:hypothetical protein
MKTKELIHYLHTLDCRQLGLVIAYIIQLLMEKPRR